MSNQRTSAYGKPADDTSFRKKYDREEYAAQAAERSAAEKEEAKLRYEAKLAGKKYHKPLTGDESLTTARSNRLDVTANVGKVTLVPAGAGVGKRGRGAGFYCAACDLTFKDSLQWVEHENSMQHLRNVGQSGEVKRATAEDVRERIEQVWQRVMREKETELELRQAQDDGRKMLDARLEVRKKEEEREREERRQKRLEEVRRKREEKEKLEKERLSYGEDVRIEGEHDEDDMMASMGIVGFGSSKK